MANKLTAAQKRALDRSAGRKTGQPLRKTFKSKTYSGKTTQGKGKQALPLDARLKGDIGRVGQWSTRVPKGGWPAITELPFRKKAKFKGKKKKPLDKGQSRLRKRSVD